VTGPGILESMAQATRITTSKLITGKKIGTGAVERTQNREIPPTLDKYSSDNLVTIMGQKGRCAEGRCGDTSLIHWENEMGSAYILGGAKELRQGPRRTLSDWMNALRAEMSLGQASKRVQPAIHWSEG